MGNKVYVGFSKKDITKRVCKCCKKIISGSYFACTDEDGVQSYVCSGCSKNEEEI